MKTCGNCANIIIDDECLRSDGVAFLCEAFHPYTPTIQRGDVKFDYPLTTIDELRIVFYAEIHCNDWRQKDER